MQALKWVLGIAAVGAGGWALYRVVEARKLGLSPAFALTNPTRNLQQVKADSVSPAGTAATLRATTGAGSF